MVIGYVALKLAIMWSHFCQHIFNWEGTYCQRFDICTPLYLGADG